ncbi:MAG: alpha/beta hydrolase, partial [Acidimicrobiales bacterium]|nr:alpha/beta hydrolase [Acidimicrobiales bacterium]
MPPSSLHPDLLPAARLVPRASFTPRRLRALRRLTRLRRAPHLPRVDGVIASDHAAPAPEGGRPVPVRLYRPADADADGPVPALLWLHGGGYLVGDAYQDEKANLALVRELGIAVASVDYRLAPEDPFPAATDDAESALRWLHASATDLGLRPDRLAVGGNSAGGGLAAAVVQIAHDRGQVPVAFQFLVYPMLDDRTVLRPDLDDGTCRLWTTASNRFGWESYLGAAPGGVGVDPYAAPARRDDLAGLPPAWIGVGTCDLFHDEDVAYA